MPDHSIFITILAGTCFFMLGISFASENLQKLAANRIRDFISKVSDKPFYGLLTGVAVTVLIQSSGAVTSMLVGLGSAGVITLRQVMGIILGTGIGTTLTVQLLSLNIAQFGLPIFAFAFTVYFLSTRPALTRAMGALMGFGLIFWGLEFIGYGTAALKNVDIFVSSLSYVRENPFVMLLLSAGVTALVHSSAVTIGIAMSLAASGLITVSDAFYWVYGANIGTTATALLASAGGNYIGRQVAWSHCFHKVSMVTLFYFFTPFFADLISTDDAFRDVANAHLLFNFMGSILFFPFINQGVKVIESLVQPGPNDKEFTTKYLSNGTFDSPAVSIAQSERELYRMGDIVLGMLRDSLELFKDYNLELTKDMRDRDNKVDHLNREISLYLTKIIDRHPSVDQREVMRLISWAADLESAADVVENSTLELANKKHNLKLEFSAEGWNDLRALHEKVVEVASLSLTAFQTKSESLSKEVIRQKRQIRRFEKELREKHIERLVARGQATLSTSSIHMDVLSDFRRVVSLMVNHAYGLAQESRRED